MLSFLPPNLRRDAARHPVNSLAFDLVFLALTAVLITASLWSVAGNGSANRRDQAAHQGVEDARPHTPAHPGRAS
jgi:hypothetical protein